MNNVKDMFLHPGPQPNGLQAAEDGLWVKNPPIVNKRWLRNQSPVLKIDLAFASAHILHRMRDQKVHRCI